MAYIKKEKLLYGVRSIEADKLPKDTLIIGKGYVMDEKGKTIIVCKDHGHRCGSYLDVDILMTYAKRAEFFSNSLVIKADDIVRLAELDSDNFKCLRCGCKEFDAMSPSEWKLMSNNKIITKLQKQNDRIMADKYSDDMTAK